MGYKAKYPCNANLADVIHKRYKEFINDQTLTRSGMTLTNFAWDKPDKSAAEADDVYDIGVAFFKSGTRNRPHQTIGLKLKSRMQHTILYEIIVTDASKQSLMFALDNIKGSLNSIMLV